MPIDMTKSAFPETLNPPVLRWGIFLAFIRLHDYLNRPSCSFSCLHIVPSRLKPSGWVLWPYTGHLCQKRQRGSGSSKFEGGHCLSPVSRKVHKMPERECLTWESAKLFTNVRVLHAMHLDTGFKLDKCPFEPVRVPWRQRARKFSILYPHLYPNPCIPCHKRFLWPSPQTVFEFWQPRISRHVLDIPSPCTEQRNIQQSGTRFVVTWPFFD